MVEVAVLLLDFDSDGAAAVVDDEVDDLEEVLTLAVVGSAFASAGLVDSEGLGLLSFFTAGVLGAAAADFAFFVLLAITGAGSTAFGLLSATG